MYTQNTYTCIHNTHTHTHTHMVFSFSKAWSTGLTQTRVGQLGRHDRYSISMPVRKAALRQGLVTGSHLICLHISLSVSFSLNLLSHLHLSPFTPLSFPLSTIPQLHLYYWLTCIFQTLPSPSLPIFFLWSSLSHRHPLTLSQSHTHRHLLSYGGLGYDSVQGRAPCPTQVKYHQK